MRLPPIAPHDLTTEQRRLYDTLQAGIAEQFQGFQTTRNDGALLGPFNPWLHEPEIGRAVWDLTEAVSKRGALSDAARQIAILVTGARFKSAYELYAHIQVAREKGLPEDKVATIVAGQRPSDLTAEEAGVFDATSALNAGGVLPRPVYDRVVAAFGAGGVSELIHLVGLYAMVCITLNGFDVPMPEQQVDPAS